MEMTLQSLQRLFDRLVGVAHYEAALRAHAQVVFAERNFDFARLDGPAYLRRQARIGKQCRQTIERMQPLL